MVKSGHLTINQQMGRSKLCESFSTYPIRLTQLESWLPYVSIMAVGFGGGLVEGDQVEIKIVLEDGASAW